MMGKVFEILMYIAIVMAAGAGIAWLGDWAIDAWRQEREARRIRDLREKHGIPVVEEKREKPRRRPSRPIADRASERRR